MTDVGRCQRWHNRLNKINYDDIPELLVLNEAAVIQWLRDHRAEYNNATETIKAGMVNFRLHRRHRQLVWGIYSRTDFCHLKQMRA